MKARSGDGEAPAKTPRREEDNRKEATGNGTTAEKTPAMKTSSKAASKSGTAS